MMAANVTLHAVSTRVLFILFNYIQVDEKYTDIFICKEKLHKIRTLNSGLLCFFFTVSVFVFVLG